MSYSDKRPKLRSEAPKYRDEFNTKQLKMNESLIDNQTVSEFQSLDDPEMCSNVSNLTNLTSCRVRSRSGYWTSIGHTVFALSILGFFLNIFITVVIVKVLKKRNIRQKPTYYFLLNLAFNDVAWTFLQICGLLPGIIEIESYIPLCLLQSFASIFRVAPSYLLLWKTIDCYIYIVHCLYYTNIMTTKRAHILCVITWFFSFTFTFAPALIMYLSTLSDVDPCRTYGTVIQERWFHASSFILVIAPLIVIFFLYAKIFYHTVRLVKRHSFSDDHWSIMRSFKRISAMCLMFCVTWLPQSVVSVMLNYGTVRVNPFTFSMLVGITTILSYLNTVLDPLLYIWSYGEIKIALQNKLISRYLQVSRENDGTEASYH